jgi:uncharacterized membrane protein YdbT with pleckstrin-like domain
MADKKSYSAIESIHDSIFILGFKLFMILFLTDLFYSLIDILTWNVSQPDFLHHLGIILLIIHIIKSIIQILLIFKVVLGWLYHKYYIDFDGKKLFEQKGFFHTQKKTFDLKNLRDVKVQQGILGQFFRYGNIVLTVTASGGYEEKIVISKIQNPQKSAEFFENCI